MWTGDEVHETECIKIHRSVSFRCGAGPRMIYNIEVELIRMSVILISHSDYCVKIGTRRGGRGRETTSMRRKLALKMKIVDLG